MVVVSMISGYGICICTQDCWVCQQDYDFLCGSSLCFCILFCTRYCPICTQYYHISKSHAVSGKPVELRLDDVFCNDCNLLCGIVNCLFRNLSFNLDSLDIAEIEFQISRQIALNIP